MSYCRGISLGLFGEVHKERNQNTIKRKYYTMLNQSYFHYKIANEISKYTNDYS